MVIIWPYLIMWLCAWQGYHKNISGGLLSLNTCSIRQWTLINHSAFHLLVSVGDVGEKNLYTCHFNEFLIFTVDLWMQFIFVCRFACGFSFNTRLYHSYSDVTITSEWFQTWPLLGTHGHWGFFSFSPTVTRGIRL